VVALAVLDVHDLGIRFGGLQALEAVTFKVEEYEIVGLMGPNGAGKTTAFNCITGFYEPSAGTVEYRGRDITSLRPDQRAALGIGRTFQQVGLVRSMTVLENLLTAQHARIRYAAGEGMIASPIALAEERDLARRAVEVLDFMGLAHLRNTKLAGLPYGTLKMVEASAVLATDPDLLLLDEPSAGMSPEESHDFGDLLLDISLDFRGLGFRFLGATRFFLDDRSDVADVAAQRSQDAADTRTSEPEHNREDCGSDHQAINQTTAGACYCRCLGGDPATEEEGDQGADNAPDGGGGSNRGSAITRFEGRTANRQSKHGEDQERRDRGQDASHDRTELDPIFDLDGVR
jgi:branched-chain amino acid transport system ATP-binding protein